MFKTPKCSNFGLFSKYLGAVILSLHLRGFRDRPPQIDVFPKRSGILKAISNNAMLISQRYVQFVSVSMSDLLHFEL